MNEDETLESQDQPLEESVDDQPEVESEESDNSEDEISEEQPEEESEEELIDVNGEKLSKEELISGYMRQSDYTKKTQNLSEQQKQLQAKLIEKEKASKLSNGEQEALDKLRSLGVPTNDDVDDRIRRILAQQRVASEMQAVKTESGLDDDMMYAAQALSLRKGISLSEAAKSLTANKPVKKVIKRKSLGAKGGVGTTPSGGKSKQITSEYINSLDPNSKEFTEIVEKWEKGEL